MFSCSGDQFDVLIGNDSQNRNASLEFVAAPALAPAEVAVDANLMEQYNRELQQVCTD